MFHTAEFYSILTRKMYDYVRQSYPVLRVSEEREKIMIGNIKTIGIQITINKNLKHSIIAFIKVDFTVLLNTPKIYGSDIERINNSIHSFLSDIFMEDIDLVLKRIDYKKDITTKNEKEAQTLIAIYNKARETYWALIKQGLYANSIRYNSKSIMLNIYQKDIERENRLSTKIEDVLDIEVIDSILEILLYKNTIRFEVQVLNKHLNYKKRYYGNRKTLDVYFSDEKSKHYLNYYLKPLFYSGNYYNLDNAISIIETSDLSLSWKRKLNNFIIVINQSNVSESIKHYSYHKFRTNIKKLKELNINPITIPDNYNIDKIKNPLSKIFK